MADRNADLRSSDQAIIDAWREIVTGLADRELATELRALTRSDLTCASVPAVAVLREAARRLGGAS